ncbi:hypothetical protein ACA910_015751 [Epithemia clementina (nom. ined.)]
MPCCQQTCVFLQQKEVRILGLHCIALVWWIVFVLLERSIVVAVFWDFYKLRVSGQFCDRIPPTTIWHQHYPNNGNHNDYRPQPFRVLASSKCMKVGDSATDKTKKTVLPLSSSSSLLSPSRYKFSGLYCVADCVVLQCLRPFLNKIAPAPPATPAATIPPHNRTEKILATIFLMAGGSATTTTK